MSVVLCTMTERRGSPNSNPLVASGQGPVVTEFDRAHAQLQQHAEQLREIRAARAAVNE